MRERINETPKEKAEKINERRTSQKTDSEGKFLSRQKMILETDGKCPVMRESRGEASRKK